MNRVIFTLILLVGFACPTFASYRVSNLNTVCIAYAAPQHTLTPNDMDCAAYVDGITSEMQYEIFSTPKGFVVGTWADGVSVDQVIRVFIKYVQANPEALNKDCGIVIRDAAVQAGLYKATLYKAPIVPSEN